MENNLVSVIIPCYNVEDYVEECLNSVLRQTYSNIEIVIVNDGSTDSTMEIIGKFEHLQSIKIINQKNSGISLARRNGFASCKGDYIIFIDSDDYFLDSNSIEKMVNKMQDDYDFIGFSFKPHFEFNKPSLLNRVISHFLSLLKLRKLENDNWAMWGKVYRRTFLERCIFPDVKFAEDIAFFIYNSTYRYKIYSHKVLVYRIRKNSLINSVVDRSEDINKILSMSKDNRFAGWAMHASLLYKVSPIVHRKCSFYWVLKIFLYKTLNKYK